MKRQFRFSTRSVCFVFVAIIVLHTAKAARLCRTSYHLSPPRDLPEIPHLMKSNWSISPEMTNPGSVPNTTVLSIRQLHLIERGFGSGKSWRSKKWGQHPLTTGKLLFESNHPRLLHHVSRKGIRSTCIAKCQPWMSPSTWVGIWMSLL